MAETKTRQQSLPGQQHGILLVNKPKGPTSTDCLEKIKFRLGQKKIGHAGTLDPNAQGLLIVLLGQGTKLAPYLGQGRKTYQGRLRLGLETDTYDIQGEVTAEHPWEDLDPGSVLQEIQAWTMINEQRVPPYSAAKYKGKPLYARARQKRFVPEKTKPVTIDHVEAFDLSLPSVSFRVVCSPGTYIRSLAHSLGKRLACGAVLTDLVREKSDPFELSQAHHLLDILEEPGMLNNRVRSLAGSLPHWPQARLNARQTRDIQNGLRVSAGEIALERPAAPGDTALLLTPEGEPLALAQAEQEGTLLYWAVLRGLWSASANRQQATNTKH